MSDLLSSDLPGGYTGPLTADQMNRLRDDLFKRHDHSSGKGGTITHSSVTDAAIPGTYLSHSILNQHVQGTGTSGTPDNPGGDRGVHGLGSSTYVAGMTKGQFVVQHGTGTTDRYNEDTEEQRGRGTFGTPYAEPPYVLVTCAIGESATVTVYQRLTTSFAVKFRFMDGSTYQGSQQNIAFTWIAFGVMNE